MSAFLFAWLLLMFVLPSVHGSDSASTAPISGKTFLQLNTNQLWSLPRQITTNALPDIHTQTEKLRRKHFFGNAHIDVSPFYFHSTHARAIGHCLGIYDANNKVYRRSIGVDATTNHTLMPQDIIHDAQNAINWDDPATNPLKSQLLLAPSIEQFGFVLTTSTPVGSYGFLRIYAPWTQVTHTLNTTELATAQSQTVEGNSITLRDFLAGTVAQDTDPNRQDHVIYGKFADKQTTSGMSDVTIELDCMPLQDDETCITLGASCTLPTTSGSTGEYFFEPLRGTYGHVRAGAHIGMVMSITNPQDWLHISGGIDARYDIGLPAYHKRTANFKWSEQFTATWARYALAGTAQAFRLTPFINLLTQDVLVKPGNHTQLTGHIDVRTQHVQLTAGYRYRYMGNEQISPLTLWPDQRYGIANYDYKTGPILGDTPDTNYHVFDPTARHTLGDQTVFKDALTGPIKSTQVLYDAGANAGQTSHDIFLFMRVRPFTSLLTEGYVQAIWHGVGEQAFGVEGYSIRCGITHQF